MALFFRRRKPVTAQPRAAEAATELFDALEQRLALFASPFLQDLPEIADMENSQNTVVRMQTSEGFIDIELYDVGGPPGGNYAPITTANFLNYVRSGRYDGTFFHRLVAGFVLQGGGFSFKDPLPSSPPRYDSVVTDDPIQNEFSELRSNIERTVAMAKLDGDPNSATSQFFFNLADNSSNLNTQNGGFTVFARVIKGWEVVEEINGFQTRNLDQFLAGQQAFFNQVPVSEASDTAVVSIIDIEVIKRKNQTEFFIESAYFPDAFRNGRSSATVELVNSDVNAGSQYIIIARFETGGRDTVIAEGFLFAGARISIPVYRGGDPSVNNVRAGVGFSYEIRSTKPLGVSVHHNDFGAATAEAAVVPGSLPDGGLREWTFANGQKGTGLGSFLVWQNLTDQPATVTATFHSDSGGTFIITKTLQPYRRGGLNVNELPLIADGAYSVRVSANHEIVASLSQYRFAPSRGSTETGMFSGALPEGVLPGAVIPSIGQSTVSVFYVGNAPSVTVNFQFILSDGTVLPNNGTFTLTTAQRRRVLDLSTANAGLPRNEPFTIRYSVADGLTRVAASYTSVTNNDTVMTPFQSISAGTIHFAGGFTDPANTNNNEVLSLYNPFRDGNVEMTYIIKFHFEHQTGGDNVIQLSPETLMGGGRRDIRVRDLELVMARITSGEQFRHYSITIEATFGHEGEEKEGAVFAQLSRFDSGGANSITTGPSFNSGSIPFYFNDPLFLGDGSGGS